MGNLFTSYFGKNLQLCFADAGWRMANPLVKTWVMAKSNEVYSSVANDATQIGQTFTLTLDDLYSQSMTVIKT